ncbi:MAG: hypothetical protein AAF433_10345 [Bacteroidota bacterium]
MSDPQHIGTQINQPTVQGDIIINQNGGTEVHPPEWEEDRVLQEVRAGLLASYQSRVDSKLAKRMPINLNFNPSLEESPTRAAIYDTYEAEEIDQELIKVFDKHKGRLLILGEPGAGKTTLVLRLAIQLIERKERQIPIIINMATWRPRFKTVQEWFLELLPQMGFSKALAKAMVEEHTILPFFDGLDELEEGQRNRCMEAIGEYGINSEVVSIRRSTSCRFTNSGRALAQIKLLPCAIRPKRSVTFFPISRAAA